MKKTKETPMKPHYEVKKVEHKIMLHYTPNAILQNVKDFKKVAEEEKATQLAHLYEDIEKILGWAFARLPMVKPPKEDGEEEK